MSRIHFSRGKEPKPNRSRAGNCDLIIHTRFSLSESTHIKNHTMATSSTTRLETQTQQSQRKSRNNPRPASNSSNQQPTQISGADSTADDALAALKRQYKLQLVSLRELFSLRWNDDDLVAVLEEVGGDLETAITRISEGALLSMNLHGNYLGFAH